MKAIRLLWLRVGFCFLAATNLYSQALFEEHILLEDFQGATCIASADFDADGDVDYVVTANDGNKVSWFENDGAQGFTEHLVVAGFTRAKTVVAARIDNNDSYDIVASSKTSGRFCWFSNDGSGNFAEHIITDSTWTSADFACSADIDGDDDNDLVLVACDNHKIAWAGNDGNGNFTIHMLKENWNKANWATVNDLDDDQDMDIIATAKAGQVIWFRNDGMENFTEQVLLDAIPGLNSVQVADFDNDGDPDLVATACDASDQVAWYENDGTFGFIQHILKNQYNGARASKIADMDQDGDTDILSIAWQSGFVHFWENKGNGSFNERVVSDDAYDMIQVCVTDLDLDGDQDILGACYASHEIRWWESIRPFLVPDFSADSISGHGSLNVSFIDLTYGNPPAESWQWDFDSDGNVDSYLQNPHWLINVPGYYTVTLVTSSDSLTDTIVKQAFIRLFDGESALEFNGANSSVKCNNDSTVNLNSSFTVEAWIRPTGFGESGAGMIFYKTMISMYACESGNNIDDSCFVLTMVHATGIVSTVCTPGNSVKLNTWQHLAFTYNDTLSELHIFIDGVDQPISIVTPPDGPVVSNGNRAIILGNNSSGNQGFMGCIDEVRLWETIRTPDEINQWMRISIPEGQTGLAGYWKMNEGSGNIASDLSGCGHSGLLNSVKWAQGIDMTSTGTGGRLPPEGDGSQVNPFLLYPNPCKGYLSIGSSQDVETVYLTDVKGMVLKQFHLSAGEIIRADMTCCPEGIYFLYANSGREYISGKILIRQ
jgi:PKD repeat protein